MNKNILNLLDELRALATTGLNYSKDPHDISRYNRILDLTSQSYADITGLSPAAIRERFTRELGYITPKIGVQGALLNEEGKILLEQRKDDGLWGLPAGWCEVGESPETSIVREFKEETNLVVVPVCILGFFTRLPGDYNQPHTSVHILYSCKYISGDLKISHESRDMRYCDPKEVSAWHKDHQQQALLALSHSHSEACLKISSSF